MVYGLQLVLNHNGTFKLFSPAAIDGLTGEIYFCGN